jgi:hypothetical protein
MTRFSERLRSSGVLRLEKPKMHLWQFCGNTLERRCRIPVFHGPLKTGCFDFQNNLGLWKCGIFTNELTNGCKGVGLAV